MKTELTIRATTPADKAWIKDLMDRDWGGEPLIVRSKEYCPSALEGLFIVDQQDVVKVFLFYDIVGQDCEIVVFEMFEKFKGLGTRVLHKIKPCIALIGGYNIPIRDEIDLEMLI